MKTQLEPQDIDAIAQRVVELLKPYFLKKDEIKIATAPPQPKGAYMTVSQLAEYLQISKGTIHNWIYQRKIPYSKIGRRVRFKSEDIVRWSEDKKLRQATMNGWPGKAIQGKMRLNKALINLNCYAAGFEICGNPNIRTSFCFPQ